MSKIYVASSWRNNHQPRVVESLRNAGYEVYDFKNPRPGDNGFHWSEIDPNWKEWTPEEYRENLNNPIADKGFKSDFDAMLWADTCVLVMPSGRSAHIEAGYFVGAGKRLVILIPEKSEPELMYRMTPHICTSLYEVLLALKG